VDAENFLIFADAVAPVNGYTEPFAFVIVNEDSKSAPCSIVILIAGTAIVVFLNIYAVSVIPISANNKKGEFLPPFL
jgi:hypothetical protein